MSPHLVLLIILAILGKSSQLSSKILASPHLSNVLSSSDLRINIVISFNVTTSPVLRQIDSGRFTTRTLKLSTMMGALEQLRSTSQSRAIRLLSPDLTYHSVWINNKLYLKNAPAHLIHSIAELPEVSQVREEYVGHVDKTYRRMAVEKREEGLEWGIKNVEADKAWNIHGGNNGSGTVVCVIDTGAHHTHEALKHSWRSQYGWIDYLYNFSEPEDWNGHGTHCTGTIAGSKGIGVAPGAEWIACRGCHLTGACLEADLIRCAQWTICPTLFNGEAEDCSKAPQIVSNSWSFASGLAFMDDAIAAWRSAGIIPIFSIGNTGRQGCESTRYPGNHPDVIGVGATTEENSIAEFSSRGPSPTQSSSNTKPDVTAPGQDVRSSDSLSDRAYLTMSGASMAVPHVSGTVALLLSKNPNLSYEEVKYILQNYNDRSFLTNTGERCGDTPSTEWPNNIYGHGKINARKALAHVIETSFD